MSPSPAPAQSPKPQFTPFVAEKLKKYIQDVKKRVALPGKEKCEEKHNNVSTRKSIAYSSFIDGLWTPHTTVFENPMNNKTEDYLVKDKNGLLIDIEGIQQSWIDKQTQYIQGLTYYELTTVRNYTCHGDALANNLLRNNLTIQLLDNRSDAINALLPQVARILLNNGVDTTTLSVGNKVVLLEQALQKVLHYQNTSYEKAVKSYLIKNVGKDIIVKAIKLFIKDLQTIVLNAPKLDGPLTLFRGVKSPFFKLKASHGVYRNNGFVSASLTPDVAYSFTTYAPGKQYPNDPSQPFRRPPRAYIQRLEVLPSTPLLILFPMSKFPKEWEILLPEGISFNLHNGARTLFRQQNPNDTCLKDGYYAVTTDATLSPYLEQGEFPTVSPLASIKDKVMPVPENAYDDKNTFQEKDQKTYTCVTSAANWSKVDATHIFDKKEAFMPEKVLSDMPMASPKLVKLLEVIAEQDARDLKKHGHTFKHMIFSGNSAVNYGAKIVVSALLASGFQLAFNASDKGTLSHKPLDSLVEQGQHNENKNVTMLLSKPLYGKPIPTNFKKRTLEIYNSRPDNVHGNIIRFIVLDGGYREGIDLYDIKYIHLFEPTPITADERQAIGRGTRFCGQKGLYFDPKSGWPLHVFKYDISIHNETIVSKLKADNFKDLQLRYSGINIGEARLTEELDKLVINAAVDSELNEAIHTFTIGASNASNASVEAVDNKVVEPMPPSKIMRHLAMQSYVSRIFGKFRYPPVKLKNNCVKDPEDTKTGGAKQIAADFTPTQDFLRHFFQPSSPYKGMLAYHSVGTGKTCTGISLASTSFEQSGYSILWVTRHTLKPDISKNLYGNIVCSVPLQEKLAKGKTVTSKDLSKNWVKVVSYKQFSNFLLKGNSLYKTMTDINGTEDPLKKTLVIIDEAHKLYAPDTAKAEKPDTDILEEMLQNSYKVSGADSVRLLLMTGTPYTKSIFEMIRLLNLLRARNDQLPTDYDTFEKEYLDNIGNISEKGRSALMDKLAGYISYLNRATDARNFAYPVVHTVYAKMSGVINTQKKNKYLSEIKVLKGELKNAKAHDKEIKKECVATAIMEYDQKTYELTPLIAQAADAKANALEKCKTVPKDQRKACKDNAKSAYSEMQSVYKEKLKDLKTNLADTKKSCNDSKSKTSEVKSALDAIKDEYDDIKIDKSDMKDHIDSIKKDIKELKLKEMEIKHKKGSEIGVAAKSETDKNKAVNAVQAKYKPAIDEIERSIASKQAALKKAKTELHLLKEKIGTVLPPELSQESALWECDVY